MRLIPTWIHGFLDYGIGLLLIVTPWVFGFADDVRVPHVILGILEIGAGLMTRTAPETFRACSGRTI